MDVKECLIVEQLRAGDEGAFRYLYDRHYILLCKFANELLGDRFLAETVVGDLFFHLWEIREQVDITTSIRSYLIRSVRNRCYNYRQQEYERREIPLSKLDTPSLDHYTNSDEHPLGTLLERELECKIAQSIENLGDECKRVFKMSRLSMANRC